VTKMPTMRGEAVTLEWPERGVALATMTRAEEMNTLSLELLDELGEVAGLTGRSAHGRSSSPVRAAPSAVALT
jgi:enoyl-CoA hydratase/carnithine racemase